MVKNLVHTISQKGKLGKIPFRTWVYPIECKIRMMWVEVKGHLVKTISQEGMLQWGRSRM